MTSRVALAAMVLTLILVGCQPSQGTAPPTQPTVTGLPSAHATAATTATAPATAQATADLPSGDVLYRATLSAKMTYISTSKEQTDTATGAVDVTFKAIQGDIGSLEIQGGTMSIADKTVGQCQGSGTFAGDIPAYELQQDRVTPTSGEGIGTLVLNDRDDGVTTSPAGVREAISFLIQLSVLFKQTCPGTGLTAGGGTTITSCMGDRSTSTTLILNKTGPTDFAGTCHDDITGQTESGTLDWTGEAHAVSP